ncbi:MAG: DUF885 domain-containing protein [Tabrizicola sp.]|nr:DUF885 domain-containing protein [Tabrizicola sp.]
MGRTRGVRRRARSARLERDLTQDQFADQPALKARASAALVNDVKPAYDRLIAAFEAAQLPSTPYGFAIDPSGKSTVGLIEGDPFKGLSPTPLIPDGDWVALQAICSG